MTPSEELSYVRDLKTMILGMLFILPSNFFFGIERLTHQQQTPAHFTAHTVSPHVQSLLK